LKARRARSKREADHPFPEPALFVLNPDGELQIIDYSNSPFARPDLRILVEGALRAARAERRRWQPHVAVCRPGFPHYMPGSRTLVHQIRTYKSHISYPGTGGPVYAPFDGCVSGSHGSQDTPFCKVRSFAGQGLLGCATQAYASFKRMIIPCGGHMGGRGVWSEEARHGANARNRTNVQCFACL